MFSFCELMYVWSHFFFFFSFLFLRLLGIMVVLGSDFHSNRSGIRVLKYGYEIENL